MASLLLVVPAAPLIHRALPKLPGGAQLALELTSEDAAGSGHRVWPAATALCRWMSGRADEFSGARVLELGCGTGAVGLYAAALGARSVLLTDGGPPAIRSLAQRNIERNAAHLAPGASVRVERLLSVPPLSSPPASPCQQRASFPPV